MTDIIKLLPDSIANQIAAGEVVQRPASVVKELLENSLDAGAGQITLVVKEAGKTLVQVIDDGRGMSENDARMCFERHATSKLRTAEDLWAIRTMGFRGEAMASIAAVAQVEMQTRPADEELGTEILIEGSDTKRIGPVATAAGTRISVKNLFFNTPARRNFLKSPNAELRHITDEFTRVALARPDVGFAFYRSNDLVYNLPATKLSQRIGGLFGKNYLHQLVPLEESAGAFSVKGYLGKPDLARKTRGEQFFFVNRRYIRHPFLHHALVSAFEGLIPTDCHPFYTLFIETDPARIDVNVHPTKTEVKFDDERALYAIVYAAARKALADFQVVPPMDFEGDINFMTHFGRERGPISEERGARFESADNTPSSPSNIEHRTSNIGFFSPLSQRQRALLGLPTHEGHFEAEGPGIAKTPPFLMEGEPDGLFPISAATGQLGSAGRAGGYFAFGGRYLATAVKSGLLLVDVEAARERIFYERFASRATGRSGLSQQAIFPTVVEVAPADLLLLEEMQEALSALGFMLDFEGTSEVKILGTPPEVGIGREKDLLEGLLEQFKQNRDQLELPRREQLARALATRAARTQPPLTDVAEMEALVNRLFATSVPNLTPSGRNTTLIINQEQIGAWMGGV